MLNMYFNFGYFLTSVFLAFIFVFILLGTWYFFNENVSLGMEWRPERTGVSPCERPACTPGS